MRPSAICWEIFKFLTYPAAICTLMLYLYPVLFGCAFPAIERREEEVCVVDGSTRTVTASETAPFRLLVFGDPQLEGDSSLHHYEIPYFAAVRTLRSTNFSSSLGHNAGIVLNVTRSILQDDVLGSLQSIRKRVDLFGNDYFLAHIYRSLYWWLQPTHTAVLGDLIGSQWVKDEEFERRGWRYWNRVFKYGRKVPHTATRPGAYEVLGDDPAWPRRIINIAGNHDIGYAGDIDKPRVARFERIFGKVNWDITFQLSQNETQSQANNPFVVKSHPELRIAVLNSMNLDSPALDPSLQTDSYTFINEQLIGNARPVEHRKSATVLLTHIPLHKREGICVDGPYFSHGPRGIMEQNHLSESASHNGILEGIFGMSGNKAVPNNGRGRNGIILTGHDHEGCDVYHHVDVDEDDQPVWDAVKWENAETWASDESVPGIREITVRSMMGSYGGYAGMLSGWFDEDAGEWKFEYDTCHFIVQHFWWGVHILDAVVLSFLIAHVYFGVKEGLEERREEAAVLENHHHQITSKNLHEIRT